jgi:pyruvyl transferase EpsO
MYNNVGDSLIFTGTLELFNELGVTLVDALSAHEPNRLKSLAVNKDTVFVLQGGGNFGDIYTLHQNFRHLLLKLYPGNKVILMPQSIHYIDKVKEKDDMEFYRSNANFILFVRDRYSFELLKAYDLKNLFLSPDVATMLHNQFTIKEVECKTLNFLRKDIEKLCEGEELDSVDWVDIISKHFQNIIQFIKYLTKKNNRLNIRLLSFFLVKWYHKKVIAEAEDYFINYSVVRTDRLHGMIFSQLLNKECNALDNSYGKLNRYISEWYN